VPETADRDRRPVEQIGPEDHGAARVPVFRPGESLELPGTSAMFRIKSRILANIG